MSTTPGDNGVQHLGTTPPMTADDLWITWGNVHSVG